MLLLGSDAPPTPPAPTSLPLSYSCDDRLGVEI